MPPVELRRARLMSFGPASSPRVVAVAFSPDEHLQALATRLNARCAALGIEQESRPFRAHITLARLKGKGMVASWLQRVGDPSLVAPITELVLFRSQLASTGPTYTVVASASLGPS